MRASARGSSLGSRVSRFSCSETRAILDPGCCQGAFGTRGEEERGGDGARGGIARGNVARKYSGGVSMRPRPMQRVPSSAPWNFGIALPASSIIPAPAFSGSSCDRSCCTADLALSHKARRAPLGRPRRAPGKRTREREKERLEDRAEKARSLGRCARTRV